MIVRTAAAALALSVASIAHSEVKPSPLFGDHAVLQSGMSVPVWGTADPGERVTVSIRGAKASAIAGADGRWMVHLKKLKAGGPFEMTIFGQNAKSPSQREAPGFDTVTVHDVLIGEVWLGSGQSNMEFPVSQTHAYFAGMLDEQKEIAVANYPQVRMFTLKHDVAYTPQTELHGEWQVCSPAVVGDWSAVGYLFARDLNQTLHVPTGVILAAYGASTAEAWIPRPTLVGDPQLKPMVDRFDAREQFFKDHPNGSEDDAPAAPVPVNARPAPPARPGAAGRPMRDPVQDQHQPTVLYNGMIAPVVPYAIRGAIWYQGESIVGGRQGVELYGHVMAALVTEWRTLWGEGDFPFYAVQLPPLKNVSNNPMVREQQAKILELPDTGLAVTIDVGDPSNVHPKNKEPVGQRLADLALAQVYGRKIEDYGPMYTGMKVEGSAIRVSFSHSEGLKSAPTPNDLVGLFPRNGPTPPPPSRTPGPLATSSAPDPAVLADAAAHLYGFQIAGADQHFVDADAKIEGNSVVVSSPAVPNPVAVRYAWQNYPYANLYNAAGLPAAPFRTDAWDALTPVTQEFTAK